MSSVYVVCWIFLQTFQTYFAYRQTVCTLIRLLLKGAVWSGSTLFAKKWLLKSQADDKADDNSCDWRFKGKHLCDMHLSTKVFTFDPGHSIFYKICLRKDTKHLHLNSEDWSVCADDLCLRLTHMPRLIFLFLHENTQVDTHSEHHTEPHRSASNNYPPRMFLWMNKEIFI